MDWNASLTHVFREVNFRTDSLAKMGISKNARLDILEKAPHVMEHVLAFDSLETCFVRLYYFFYIL